MNGTSQFLDIRRAFGELVSGWTTLLISGILFAAIMTGVLVNEESIYRSEAVLAPASRPAGGSQGISAQLGSVAGLAGFSLPDSDRVSETDLGLAVVQSREFVGHFFRSRQLVPALLAASHWDETSGELTLDQSVFDVSRSEWVGLDGEIPSIDKIHRAFTERFYSRKDARTGLIFVSFDHLSPEIAAQWISWLIEDVNLELRSRDVEEAEKSLQFLSDQVENSSVVALKDSLYDLIQEQTKTVMLAQVREEYVFRVVDKPSIPDEPHYPQRLLLVIVAFLAGLLFGAGVLLFRSELVVGERSTS